MSNLIETEIIECEERLRLAMLHSDVKELDELLAPELRFTSHLGELITKQDDLELHQSGLIKIEAVTPSEQYIKITGNVAIVFVRLRIVGTYAGAKADGDFRFTRIWTLSSNNTWHVVAGHSTLIA
ncbi:nuclear transport factor 2 family protein [Limnofasciculus baicalensis]|uniref:Nuclear transport factor 2 family protein n=1 Tax=Limnofasciculus baicalensis BBK-W-15 TaxID=2699891 RepID=A0AAE3KU65_9CYAN|nr:nuclear transport factor 2 family protein [Limnofasciculus baicalensis]MCP2731177.1 nuclear transport factor 2 family protein [Limnofasciculus baicalensis BBK-W-15]